MTPSIYNIYWNDFSSDTYLYGSQIEYIDQDRVHFINMLMPPGTVIKEWYSKVNFQAQRIEPTLPIIDGETSYKVNAYIDSEGKFGWIIRFVFYDKYEMEAGSYLLQQNEGTFRCPLKTYSYKMQLINGGLHEFTFRSVAITEIVSD